MVEEQTYGRPAWADNPYQAPNDVGNITQRAINMYLMSRQPNGEMGGIGWWQSANGYTAMALHDLRSGSKDNYEVTAAALKQCESRRPGFINEFNDDTLWWAMCCVHLHSIAGDAWFLEKAKAVWHHVYKSVCRKGQVQFHGEDMEGACYWTTKADEDQINAITTGLFAELSVRLAAIAKSNPPKHFHMSKLFSQKEVSYERYVDAARCSLGWIFRCRYRPREGVVLDNIRLKKQEAFDWTWSYNTGVAIGGCGLLYEQLQEEEYLMLACHMANTVMQRKGWVEGNGVLTEPDAFSKGRHDPLKNCDGVGFKAISIRQLGTLLDVIERTSCKAPVVVACAQLIKIFINVNFQSQVEHNTNGNDQYGPWWNGPFDTPTSHSQMAALDVMAAVRLMNKA